MPVDFPYCYGEEIAEVLFGDIEEIFLICVGEITIRSLAKVLVKLL